ncbi:recombinase family protein [Thermomonas carbonis]|uniref:Recombinase family protein n=1 Tax=Thermomonas carbonis TaxID=1463158 RepID=A0A7G9SLP0_9GAMM|nr:recombinase family protein [Thermomonas carbonis]QNN68765.1 recombinase family protein [Thermomonas carbonis]GHC08928.1 integrase [Thermomonas carbonis]
MQKGDGGAVRCAIYTRKSSEEGLDQAFNSLDAQREACEAYAASQRHEGWKVMPTHYDDGGFSGGNLTRPALQRLMADIKAGLIDLVVVYKIDRLTRSLMDFSKLVEVFDQHETSFVSVTQHFNTTSSMGRLTLNVLLSFAQFEREVTGERIRDKIAASKRKGMWMGGNAPLGYGLLEKKLVVDPEESDLVTRIYERYLVLGCVQALKRELDAAGTRGRVRLQRGGSTTSASFSRGGLYAILNQRLYRGETHHAGEWFPGQHPAIVPAALWEKVQAQLASKRHTRKLGTNTRNPSLLASLVVDPHGHRLMPVHTSKGGKRYRYYLLRPGECEAGGDAIKRLCLPAFDLERIATEQWLALLTARDLDLQLKIEGPDDSAALRRAAEQLAERWKTLSGSKQRELLFKVGARVVVDERHVELSAGPEQLAALLLKTTASAGRTEAGRKGRLVKAVDANLMKAAGETRILEESTVPIAAALTPGHKTLLMAIAQGRAWARALTTGEHFSAEEIVHRTGIAGAHVTRGLKCLRVPPDLVARLAEGKAPPTMTWAAIRSMSEGNWNQAISEWRGSDRISQKEARGFPARPETVLHRV